MPRGSFPESHHSSNQRPHGSSTPVDHLTAHASARQCSKPLVGPGLLPAPLGWPFVPPPPPLVVILEVGTVGVGGRGEPVQESPSMSRHHCPFGSSLLSGLLSA